MTAAPVRSRLRPSDRFLFALGRSELRRFRGLMPKIALVFVTCIPLLYAAIYLTANWDPYGRIDRVPVAVVNEDRPATLTVNGEKRTVDAGKDFTQALIDKRTFDFQAVDAATAQRGLDDGTYFLTIVVPADFSERLISGAGEDPQRAGIEMRRNDANGFVVGSIVSKAQDAVTQSIDASAIEAYFRAVFANLSTIRDGLVDARDGAQQLADGLGDAHDGSAKLADGAATAATGSQKLAAGAHSLSSGLGEARSGAASLSSGLKKLDTGSTQVADGACSVANGTQQLADTALPPLKTVRGVLADAGDDVTTVADAAADLTAKVAGRSGSIADDLTKTEAAVDQLVKAHPDLADDPAVAALRSRLAQASSRADQATALAKKVASTTASLDKKVRGQNLVKKVDSAISSVNKLNAGAHQVASGAKQVSSGVHSAATGAASLSTGLTTAANGANSLATNLDTLHSGLGTLSSGATSLNTGIGKLDAGATKLADSLGTAVKRMPVYSADQVDDAVQVLSQPVDVSMTVENPATYYGRGLAPMFFSIAMWVFGISVFLVVRPITGRALAGRASVTRLALAAWAPIGTIAVAAGLLMIGVVWAVLGLDPVNPGATIGLTVLGAVCFSLIAHLLRTALGTVGSSLMLVFLILQLTSAGGLYPAQMVPGFFAAIGHVMPMTYLIDAYRIAISGGLQAHLVRDVVVLLGITVVTAIATVLVVARRKQLSLRDLHPPLVAP